MESKALESEIRVRRCVCAWVSFAELKEAGVTTLADAAVRFGAGAACGACRPYLQRMIETGETEFPVLEEFSP